MESYTAKYRTAAVSLDLALSPVERETIIERVKAGAPAVRMQPVCALIGMGLNYDDGLPWTEPVYEDNPDFDQVWAAAASWLPAGEERTAWRAVAVLGAAYLLGRQPEVPEVLGLASRAALSGFPRLGSEEGQRLLAAFDRYAADTIPGGMGTAPSPSLRGAPDLAAGFVSEPVALRIVADALGRPVPQAGQFISGLYTEGTPPGQERVLVTTNPQEARWFASHREAHAYWTQQHGLRPWDGEPNRPLTAYSIEFVSRSAL